MPQINQIIEQAIKSGPNGVVINALSYFQGSGRHKLINTELEINIAKQILTQYSFCFDSYSWSEIKDDSWTDNINVTHHNRRRKYHKQRILRVWLKEENK